MVQYIITPWRNPGELLRVRQKLYPRDQQHGTTGQADEERRHAVAQVSVWMQRGNCPHLVESTAILTSALLNDVPGNSSYCVRAAYSAAFCRFVTGLLDSHQDKRHKLSMYSIAKTIGLPATYVELRHQATHEELPSLSKLRTATQKALRWIWEYYWVKLASEAPQIDSCETFVRKLVAEENPHARAKMEMQLSGWNANRLLDVLTGIYATAEDAGVLLRCLQLHEKISSSRPKGKQREMLARLALPPQDLDEVRVDMHKDEQALEETQDINDSCKTAPSLEVATNQRVKGWVQWEGPWIPKPIGVV